MNDAAVAVISGVLSGGFALAGVGLSGIAASRRERAEFSRETALELAGMERLVWGDSWIELTTEIQRQEARWAIAGVPADLIQAFRASSVACWRDQRQTVERSAGQHAGIGKDLLEARETVQEAARAFLLRSGSVGSREALRIHAIEVLEASLPDRA
jgi:hypothetical protein